MFRMDRTTSVPKSVLRYDVDKDITSVRFSPNHKQINRLPFYLSTSLVLLYSLFVQWSMLPLPTFLFALTLQLLSLALCSFVSNTLIYKQPCSLLSFAVLKHETFYTVNKTEINFSRSAQSNFLL